MSACVDEFDVVLLGGRDDAQWLKQMIELNRGRKVLLRWYGMQADLDMFMIDYVHSPVGHVTAELS